LPLPKIHQQFLQFFAHGEGQLHGYGIYLPDIPSLSLIVKNPLMSTITVGSNQNYFDLAFGLLVAFFDCFFLFIGACSFLALRCCCFLVGRFFWSLRFRFWPWSTAVFKALVVVAVV